MLNYKYFGIMFAKIHVTSVSLSGMIPTQLWLFRKRGVRSVECKKKKKLKKKLKKIFKKLKKKEMKKKIKSKLKE